MSDAKPILAAEGGVYSSTGPSITLSGTIPDFGNVLFSRTFAVAAADANNDFIDGSTFTAYIVKTTDKTVFAYYEGITWNAGAPDIVDLSTGTIRSVGSPTVLANGDPVYVIAQYPYTPPASSGISRGDALALIVALG